MNTTIKTLAVSVAALSFANQAMATSDMDDIRDALKAAFNNSAFSANYWRTSGTGNASNTITELEDLTEYATSLRGSITLTVANDGQITATVNSGATWSNDDTWDGHVDALADGIMDDMWGTHDSFSSIIDVDAESGFLSLGSVTDGSIAAQEIADEIATINSSIAGHHDDPPTATELSTIATTFNGSTDVSALNGIASAWNTQNTELSGIDSKAAADDYGLLVVTYGDHDFYISGGEVFCSYEDYILDGTPEISDYDDYEDLDGEDCS